MNRADIVSGAVSGSVTIGVRCNEANGTTVVVSRGIWQLGTATLAGGVATVSLSQPLATGDVIQASVTEIGNQAGISVVVVDSEVEVTGWRTATEVEIRQSDGTLLAMPVDLFFQNYGYMPAGVEDPAGTREILLPEFDSPGAGEIGFDLTVTKVAGTTTVSIVNAFNILGTLLVKWGSAGWSSTNTVNYTASQSVEVRVRGSSNPVDKYASRTIAVDVLPSSGGSTTPDPPPPPPTVDFGFTGFWPVSGTAVRTPPLSCRFAPAIQGAVGTVEFRYRGGSWTSETSFLVQQPVFTKGPYPTYYEETVGVEVRTSSGQYASGSVRCLLYAY